MTTYIIINKQSIIQHIPSTANDNGHPQQPYPNINTKTSNKYASIHSSQKNNKTNL